MLPASVKGPGMNMGFPDVCLTPSFPSPIPIPYPNMGMHAMAAPFCPTILNTMMPALNMASIIPMTLGDQPGVANPLFMQMGTFTTGSPKVLLQGMPAITLTSPTTGNAMNNPVGAVLVPGAPTILYGYAAPAARLDADAIDVGAPSPAGVARVAVRVFSPSLPARIHAALSGLARAGAVLVRLDLRGNPGGDVRAAIEVLRDLVADGAVVAELEDAAGDRTSYRGRGDLSGLPLVIEVNGATASAAELFAGSLQSHRRALVIGTRTYGKGASAVALGRDLVDVARMLLPSGAGLEDGVTPDAPALEDDGALLDLVRTGAV